MAAATSRRSWRPSSAALAAGGAEVDYLTVTDDLVGVLDATLSDEEAAARLRSEARPSVVRKDERDPPRPI